ncbi:MAG: hypothetical protein ACYS3S_02350, partial [Planctomycetota bacterium]
MWSAKKSLAVLMLTCALIASNSSGTTENNEPKATELVQAVRASENLYIRIETKLIRTPEVIAAKTTELKQQYPDIMPDSSEFPELKPVSTGILEFAIDKQRVRSLSEERDSRRQVKIWDGKQLMAHDISFLNGQDQYSLGRS